jgi:rhomboid family GlyGly-CTERM serine protease
MPDAASFFELQRTRVFEGEVWRLFSCHLTHCSGEHLLWDVLTFAALGFICELHDRRRFIVCLFASACFVSLSIFYFHPEITFYRGLSGIDSALFGYLLVVLLVKSLRDKNRKGMILILFFIPLFMGKTVYELVSGSTFFVSDYGAGITPLPVSHVAGFMVGACIGFFPESAHQRSRRKKACQGLAC